MLTIVNSYGLRGVSFEPFYKIEKIAKKIVPQARPSQLILHFVSDQKIRKLNKTYRKLDQVTDVLSFSYLDEQFGDEIGGEIYIAIKRAKEQAVTLGHSLTRELAFLFSHGLLHIYGYEHSKKRQTSILENLQDKILVMASVSPE